jgi:SAM-dependent methyltransferase
MHPNDTVGSPSGQGIAPVSVFLDGAESPANLSSQYLQRGMSPDRLQLIKKYAGRRVLDVGCGNGAYVLGLADDYDMSGVDHQKFATWDQAPGKFQIGQADELTCRDEQYDTLLSFECLEHLPRPEQALREYYRVTRHNLILTVPNCTITLGMKQSNLLYSHWGDRTHVNFYTLAKITEAVQAAGFSIAHSGLIHRVNLVPFFLETVGVPTSVPGVNRLLSKVLRKSHYITCAVVGEKK